MKHHTLILSEHRLGRLTRWLWLVLQMMAACVFAAWLKCEDVGPILREPLAHIRKQVLALILVRALARVPGRLLHRCTTPAAPGLARRGFKGRAWRLALGMRLWKMTRGDVGQTIVALVTLLANPEPEIARLAKRLAHGLTRLNAIVPIAPPALLFARAVAAPTPHATDSS